ncbi:two-component regulator propeller domain-containing protein [Ignavibacterium sp.]|uniref:type IX secretion system anionic LPS delivery protein PorZ n=1 Tax=Ignavibacterium sp. TaxID=2651167 RepID=UPI00220E3C95|nr:two-component regulator propeller domain-containing protein [Ignavibacterium sp.]BDQ02659.1 MAG: ABC transporter substrate-binding protein [Ignavibacterium sp.]
MKNLFFSLIIFYSIQIFPQIFTDWKNYSDMKSIKSVVTSGNELWAASSGGVFNYNFSSGEYKKFGKAEGLFGTDVNAIAIDNYGKIWFGSSTGLIDVYDPSNNSFSTIRDIFNSDRTNKGINSFSVKGDTIFVATDFGISLIDTKSFFFYDTYFKFGTFPSNIKVNKIFLSNLIYAATESGVAIQKQGSTNLSAPESWNVYNTNNGLPSIRISDITIYEGNILASSDKGIYVFDSANSLWSSFIPQLNSTAIINMLVAQNKLYCISSDKLFEYSNSNLNELFNSASALRNVFYSDNFGIILSTSDGVLTLNDNKFYFPNGPVANQFPQLSVDVNSVLWSSTGNDVTGKGIQKFDGNQWTVYSVSDYPELLTNSFFSIYCAPDGKIYSGNWGKGFVRIDDNRITRFDASNSPMVGIPGDGNFIVITALGYDSRNNLWALNFDAADRNNLAMLTPDSSWYVFQIPAQQGRVVSQNKNLVIDQYDTKWFNADNGTKGLYYFNENKTFTNPADDKSGLLTESNGLNSVDISAIKVDRRGDVWVGTSRGLNIITNTSTILNSANPQLRITSVFALRQQVITAIAVDPLNQKWIGTNEGLILVSSDGLRVIANLNSKNSPLLDDRIESLAVDEKTGKVFVGTKLGLNTFETPAIKPVDSFSGLFIYPSPFVISDGSQLVTIDGLIRDSEIKILTVSGKLVRKLETPGGRVAFWDGRDDDGNLVNSGIYVVVASDREANSVETGKIAVIRK